MLSTFKHYARSVGVAGSGLALAGAVTLPIQAFAHDDAADKPALRAATAAPPASNQVVVRDAATGQLRAATAEEAQALQPRAFAGRSAQAQMLPRLHTSGARGTRLTDEFMSYSVLVRQADGSMATVCVDSREEAEALTKASSLTKTATAPTE